MSEAVAIVPPFIILLVAALAIVKLPHRIGHAVGAAAMGAVMLISLLVPSGTYFDVSFLGFDVVLFAVDEFSRLLGFGFGFLGAMAVIYAASSDAPRVTTAFAISYVGATIGAVFAGDWLTLLFFWELMAVTSTLLVWHYGGRAVRAGYRYAIAHGIGGSLLLFAVIWHYASVGALHFGAGATGIADGVPALLAAIGIGVNCGFIILHTWLPDTYPKPHFAASVFLSIFTTKTGAYVLYRAFPDGELMIAYMGGAMAVYGVVFALLQHDMRALLSYHIQAQVGYMVAGIGIGSAIGIAGAMGHLFNNVLYKALLFMAIGVIIYRTGENDLYKLGGLWRKMPITAIAYLIGALSITAVPGFNGFISKGMVLDAANPAYYGGPEYQALYWLLMIGAIGTFLSFIKLGYYTFLHGESTRMVRDAKPGQSAAMLSVAALCIIFGLWWQGLVDLLPLMDPVDLNPYSVGHLTDAVLLGTFSVVAFVVIRKPLSKLGHIHDMDAILNPVVFHSGRLAMLGVTELYAAVDRIAVRFVRLGYWAGNHPVTAVAAVTEVLPITWSPVGDETPPSPDGGRQSTLALRASIGLTVLLITAVLSVTLYVLLL